MKPQALDAELFDRALVEGRAERQDLQALVDLARAVEDAFAADPSPASVDRGREAALIAFAAARPASETTDVATIRPGRSRPRRLITRALVAALLLVAVPTAALAASWPAARDSLPGDALYPVKLGVERARLLLARGAAAEAGVYLDLAQSRLREAVRAGADARDEAMAEALRRYLDTVGAIDRTLADARVRGEDVEEVLARTQATFAVHVEVLAALSERVPDAARAGIQRAVDVARRHGPPEGVGPPTGGSGGLPSAPTEPGDAGGPDPDAPEGGPPIPVPVPAAPPEATGEGLGGAATTGPTRTPAGAS